MLSCITHSVCHLGVSVSALGCSVHGTFVVFIFRQLPWPVVITLPLVVWSWPMGLIKPCPSFYDTIPPVVIAVRLSSWCPGVCLGLQCAVIEFARNVLGWADAHSTEADATTTHPVVCFTSLCSSDVLSDWHQLVSQVTDKII